MSINVKKNGELTKIAGLYQTTAPVGMADCYSTEEKIVGCWTDGKPLYQKSFEFTSGWVLGSWNPIADLSSLNIENFISAQGRLSRGNLNLQLPFEGSIYPESSNNYKVSFRYYAGNLETLVMVYNDIDSLVVTIQYTKTTDTPGSGQWTPSGDIAKHYSTEEQVIGTWIDGSTLYETTVSWPSVTADGNTLITLSHGISNIAKVINFDFIFGSDSYKFKSIPLTDPAWFAMVSAVTRSSVQYRLGTSYSSYGLTITIQYTKTTD